MTNSSRATLRGSMTEKNLLKAFSGESQDAVRYGIFADIAREEGYEMVASIFNEVVHNERTHALIFYRLLDGGMLDITASYPAGSIGSTLDNLSSAANVEYDEWSDRYSEYAQVAKDEGFIDVALAFEYVVGIERMHEDKFLMLKRIIEDGKMFKRDEPIEWVCMECGFEHTSTEASKVCPFCHKEQAYFKPLHSICSGLEYCHSKDKAINEATKEPAHSI